ncbi:MAG: folylpolyglutamate synthase/dihydrofolate synthase family protein [Thiohalomonadales bacterium]
MRFDTVDEWLRWQQGLHTAQIDLGLQRLVEPFRRLAIDFSKTVVFTVAGTNGKGSCVAFLSAILQQAGYRVGSYTSPHLFSYSERIRIDNVCIPDADLCQSFAAVDEARKQTTITYFEFATLAALDYFNTQKCDVLVLEVGLGGRLDAVNIVDPDVAIITNISLDHTDWLGDSREDIALEKSGILREKGILVCGEKLPPQTLLRRVRELNVNAYFINDAFHYRPHGESWCLQIGSLDFPTLPLPNLIGDFQILNAATAITALAQIPDKVQICSHHIETALNTVRLAGRFQMLSHKPDRIVDVAHNVGAAETLVKELTSHRPNSGVRHAVFALQTHKDVDAIIAATVTHITVWHLAPLLEVASVPVSEIETLINKYDSLYNHVSRIKVYSSITDAWCAADQLLNSADDVLLGFGSFYTVSEILLFEQKMRIIL